MVESKSQGSCDNFRKNHTLSNWLGYPTTLSPPKRRVFFCKDNLMISTTKCDSCKGKPKLIYARIHKDTTHLARENQRENSRVSLAKGASMYSTDSMCKSYRDPVPM